MDWEIGVMGGSGFYQMDGFDILEERVIETPFGRPSDKLVLGKLEGRRIAFLARHGRRHSLNPTHVPYLANIWAMKSLGVKWLVSVAAVGSLKEELAPRDVVIPDQIIDRTKHRPNSFFDPVAVHASFGDPYCPILSNLLTEAATSVGITTHRGGTYVCMEGPLFSTRAESNLYRSWGASVIGMTAIPEAKLAREAEIAYASLCFVTDYDCWHLEEVTVDLVIENLHANARNAGAVIHYLAAHADQKLNQDSPAHTALNTALLTAPADYPPHILDKVRLLLKRVCPDI